MLNRFTLLALLMVPGCSLIVGNKLDEKPGADGTVRRDGLGPDGVAAPDRGPQPTAVRGELGGSGVGPYLIGERIEIPVWQWSTATQVTIGSAFGSIPCVGEKKGSVFVCTVSPLTSEGGASYYVKDDKFAVLNAGGTKIEIRRLIGSGANGTSNLILHDQASLKPEGVAISLPGTLTEPPKMSLSGRYLLAALGSGGLVLVDLVNRAVAPLPPQCKLLGGSVFEPEHAMRKLAADGTPFMFFRPERGLLCSEGPGSVLQRIELPDPPVRIDKGQLPLAPAPSSIKGVVDATTSVDLAGRKWIAGVVQNGSDRQVFAAEIGKPPAFALGGSLVPQQAVLVPLEVQSTPVFSDDFYLIALAKQGGASPVAVLLHLEGNVLQVLQQVPLELPTDLMVDRLVWVTYTNLVALQRSAGSSSNLAYLRLGTDVGKPHLQLLKATVVASDLQIQAFPVTPLDVNLFWASYNRRFGQVAGNRIVVYQDAPAKGVLVDDTVSQLQHGTVRLVVAHPVLERLLVLTDQQLIAFKFGFGKTLTKEAGVSIDADGILIQP